MRRDLRRSIRKSAGRYLAILAIIALGSGFLVGLRSTKGDMMATAQTYIDKQALFTFGCSTPMATPKRRWTS